MNIDQALKLLETYVEQDIKDLEARDRLNFWQALSEFNRPKIQRANFEPNIDKDTQILIAYNDEPD